MAKWSYTGRRAWLTWRRETVVFSPPDTEHGLRTPNGGRWLAVWLIGERVPGKRCAG